MWRWRAGAAATAVGVAALAVWWSGTGTAVTPRPASTAGPAQEGGCAGRTAGTAVPGPGAQTVTIAVAVAGHRRSLLVHLPPTYPDQAPVPLLLALHGSGSTAARQERSTELDRTADEHSFIVAYPQGELRSGAGFAWNIPGVASTTARRAGPDDVAYLKTAIAVLQGRYCIDPDRTYATGFSGGARMVSAFACLPQTGLSGIAAVGGLRAPQPCRAGRPMSVIAFHGTADQSNPYLGHGQPYWTYSVPQAADRWALTDRCPSAGHPRQEQLQPGVELISYTGCAGGVAVVLYALDGVGHRWPVPPTTSGIATTPVSPDELDLNEIMWAFLDGHLVGGQPLDLAPAAGW